MATVNAKMTPIRTVAWDMADMIMAQATVELRKKVLKVRVFSVAVQLLHLVLNHPGDEIVIKRQGVLELLLQDEE